MKKIRFFTILFFAVWLSLSLVFEQDLYASPTVIPQAIPFTEDFEGVWSGGAPELWSREYIHYSTDWIQASGGDEGHPPSAHGGSYNALFEGGELPGLFNGVVTRLISPPLDFGPYTHNARLTFWYTMEEFGGDTDDLDIYYRTSSSGSWTLLPVTCSPFIAQWTKITVNLPDPGSDYYVCFEGKANYGYGVCIDDVLITGDIAPTPSPAPTPDHQLIPFTEDFEGVWSGGAPVLWSREYIHYSSNWGQTSGGLQGHPTSAHGGSYNAWFFSPALQYQSTTRLISPPLDFGPYTHNARLTFWYTMEEWVGKDNLDIYYRSSAVGSWTLLPVTCSPFIAQWTKITVNLPDPGSDYYVCFEGKANGGYGVCIDDVLISGDIAPTTLSPIIDSGDYDGDGTSDIGIFRETSGLWAIRGITRVYFGSSNDLPVPGDYNGNNTTDIGIFRSGSGLWAIKGVTRSYFGSLSDTAVPGDYNGDDECDLGIFRSSSGLWAIKGITRAYFGGASDSPAPGYYNGDSTKDIGIFRSSSGLWAIKGISRIYFGSPEDETVPGDYDGDGAWNYGIFRSSSGLWAIRGVTRSYFGSGADQPIPGAYKGNGRDDIGIFRATSGLWAIRGVTRAYFGGSSDIPVTR